MVWIVSAVSPTKTHSLLSRKVTGGCRADALVSEVIETFLHHVLLSATCGGGADVFLFSRPTSLIKCSLIRLLLVFVPLINSLV